MQDLRALLKRIHEEGESQLDKLMKNNVKNIFLINFMDKNEKKREN